MPRILLTGFGPFGSHEVNPTEDIVKTFPTLIPMKNPFGRGSSEVLIEKRILSVDESGSRWTANELNKREWDAILHLGLCGECTSPRIELLAQDRLNMRIADNSGRRVQNRILSGTGHLQTPVPVKKWKVSTWDSDVELSQDAGQFICNETYFRTHEALNKHKFAIPCLFLHLPPSEFQSKRDAAKLVRKILAHMLYKPQIQVSAGVIHDERGFLAMKRSENQPSPGKWEFPGGTIELDESPEDALLREFREELSIDVSIIKKAGVWQHTYPFFHVEIHVFLVESSELESIQMSVHSEKKWISSSKDFDLDWLEADIPIVEDLLNKFY